MYYFFGIFSNRFRFFSLDSPTGDPTDLVRSYYGLNLINSKIIKNEKKIRLNDCMSNSQVDCKLKLIIKFRQ